jgi:hypothetical protein
MTRGDDEDLTVSYRKDGVTVPFVTGDTVSLTVKKSINDSVSIIQSRATTFTEEGKALITITHAQTENLPYGDYVYDVEVVSANGKHTTIISYHKFTIGGEVTDE